MAHSAQHNERILKTLRQAFNFGFNVDKFLERAIREAPQGAVGEYAYALIINSQAFRNRFPGIFRANGTLRISPGEYIQREEAFASTAAQYGFGLTRSQIGGLVRNNVDPNEFAVRAQGVQQATANPDLIKYLNQQISRTNQQRRRAAGDGDYARIPLLRSTKDVVNFFTGRGDRAVYAIYEGALFQESAEGFGLDLSPGRARQLAGRTVGVLEGDDVIQRFADIAHRLRLAGVELGAEGITQRDLEVLEFGGPGRAAIADKAERILKQREAQLATRQATGALTLSEGRPVSVVQEDAGY